MSGLVNSNTPVFDTICDATERIIPHFYIMGFEFQPGTFELGAQVQIPDYLTATDFVTFGQTIAQGFGPLIDINSFSSGLKKLKIGIVLTALRNYATYPNSDQDFSYSAIYTPVTLFNKERPITQGQAVGEYNRNRFDIPKLTNQIFGLASFSIAALPTDCTSIDVNVEIIDLYTIIVQTDNIDELKDVFIAADFFTLNTNDLCGVTGPTTEMVQIAKKTYTTLPDLENNEQNIQQISSNPMQWYLEGHDLTNGSQLITFNISLDF